MKYTTIFFKNSLQIEGYLSSVEDNKIILKSIDGNSEIIVPDVEETVLYYKINHSADNYNNLLNKKSRTEQDLIDIVKARGDLIQQEKKIISNFLKSDNRRGIKENDEYLQSNTNDIEHTQEKATRKNSSITSGLQRMFSKKY